MAPKRKVQNTRRKKEKQMPNNKELDGARDQDNDVVMTNLDPREASLRKQKEVQIVSEFEKFRDESLAKISAIYSVYSLKSQALLDEYRPSEVALRDQLEQIDLKISNTFKQLEQLLSHERENIIQMATRHMA